MDYYQTMRNDYIHKAMYPDDPMRKDWIPKGPPQGTLTIKPKERCPPKFVSKIEGNAVEESARVFFEGIVDAQPQPKFSWYFEDEPVIPGQKGWEDAEIHDSRKMSTLILKYTREYHMGKYTLVAQNQLGAAECSCDLIVRKKQFPPVFWQRLYNVAGEGSRRFVGEVEVGGWPVPEVYWYKVNEDGEEEEVSTKTHTENYNGFPNKYVPERRIEVRQLDQIRHQIIFHQASDCDSGLYRVRAINALGEAECEAELKFEGCGDGEGGNDLYLPPLWKERKRLNWKDEDDQRRKPFVGFVEPELTDEDLAEMRRKCAGVPLGRIMEYLASLPDYVPSDKFRHMDKMPFKAGVDERDYRPDRKGGKCSFPSVFEKGKIVHRGYNLDVTGRILPLWQNPLDKRARDLSELNWRPVHPDLWVPELPDRCQTPPAPPIWETDDDLKQLVLMLNGMGCKVPNVTEIKAMKRAANQDLSVSNQQAIKSHHAYVEQQQKTVKVESTQQVKSSSKVEKFSYIMPNEHKDNKNVEREHLHKAKEAKTFWEDKLKADQAGAQTNAASFTAAFMAQGQMYERHENMSFPELEVMSESRPALPPKTKIMNSPSRNIFSPTDSIESNGMGTASVKTVEFIPVKEKVKLIAAQQEELNRREEASQSDIKKHKGVRILPPSPITVRKMSVEDELHQYDEVVTRTTPVMQVMDSPKPEQMMATSGMDVFAKKNEQHYHSTSGVAESRTSFASKSEMKTSYQSMTSTSSSVSFAANQNSISASNQQEWSDNRNIQVPGWTNEDKSHLQTRLDTKAKDEQLDSALDQLIAETQSITANREFFSSASVSEKQQFNSYSQSSVRQQSEVQTFSTAQTMVEESPAEECRRSFEEAELEAMALASETSKSFSKQSSLVETASTQSFVLQSSDSLQSKTALIQAHFGTKPTAANAAEAANDQAQHSSILPGGKDTAYVRTPDTFVKQEKLLHAQQQQQQQSRSVPSTPLSQRRRLRINQSPKPPEADADPRVKYRDGPSAPFQPGFYRPPPEDPNKAHVFQLVRRSSSRTRMNERIGSSGDSSQASPHQSVHQPAGQPLGQPVRISQASSRAYEGDESDLERN